MLDKKLNKIIHNAFQLSHVKNPNSDLTEQEFDDAVFNLNCMLQNWNNDGFRLFKIKEGYLPLMPGQSDYMMASQAYKKLFSVPIRSFEQIGATKIQLDTVRNMAQGLKIFITNSAQTIENQIKSFEEESGIVEFDSPVRQAIVTGSDVFYGEFHTAETPNIVQNSVFTTIEYTQTGISPEIGDTMLIQMNDEWARVQVTAISSNTITFVPQLGSGDITSSKIYFGSVVEHTVLHHAYPLGSRKVNLAEPLTDDPVNVAFNADGGLSKSIGIESIADDRMSVILNEPVAQDVLVQNGVQWLDAYLPYPSESLVKVTDFASLYQDISKVSIVDYVSYGNQEYIALFEDATVPNERVFWRPSSSQNWSEITVYQPSFNHQLMIIGSRVVMTQTQSDMMASIVDITGGGYTPFGPSVYGGVRWVVSLLGHTYFIGGSKHPSTSLRDVFRSDDVVTFSDVWQVALDSAANAVEYKGKMFCGDVFTFATSDMKTFEQLPIHADARCVVGDRMVGINANELCNYTDDGINFEQIPFVFSRESAWASTNGMSIISIYNLPESTQPNVSQIFLANDFNCMMWNMNAVVDGLCHKIKVSGNSAIFVAANEVGRMSFNIGTKANENSLMYCFGDPIGRPQEVMNIVRYDKRRQSQYPIAEIALADFKRLPHGHGEEGVTQCCFLRESEDAKLMVWGTPKEFGDFLQFSYVEPFALLLDPREVPDFPDEYLAAVIEGLAYELAKQYGAPAQDVEVLRQSAETLKQNCLLHDNESTSYRITPNMRNR